MTPLAPMSSAPLTPGFTGFCDIKNAIKKFPRALPLPPAPSTLAWG